MIPFIDLAAQQQRIRSELERRIQAVLAHGQYIMGPEVKELEKRLAGYAGVKHAVGCSSGTDALLMPLMAYGVKPGDAIFITPFTFIATGEVIALLGATPVFVDIDPGTFNMDPEKLALAVRAVKAKDPAIHPLPRLPNPALKPKGCIPVDLFGLPAEYDRINAIAREHGLFVLEDAAQSFGGVYHGKKAGALASVGATSFFPAKPLGCYGDGGAVFTDEDDFALVLDSIRVHGKGKEKYDNVRVGINGRLDTLQAAILLPKMDIFEEEIEARNRVAERYSKGLAGCVQVPFVPAELRSAWAQYSIVTPRRKQVQELLQKNGVPTAIYYPKSLHQQTAFSYLGYQAGDFPVSEAMSETIVSLPMHPYLADDVVDRIVSLVQEAVAG